MIEDTKKFFDHLGTILAPVFEEQRAVWEHEGPAAEARAAALGIVFDDLGGNCPVQAEGSFDQQRFYFRARGSHWQFHAWTGDACYMDAPNRNEWVIEREYGVALDAGWMHVHEAIYFICECVEEYRASHSNKG